MLDTTSSNEFPLFGTMSSSSCGMESIVIQRPLVTESYSWSDFPIAYQEDSRTTTTAPSSTLHQTPIATPHYGCQSHTSYIDSGNDLSSSCSLSRSSSESSNCSMTSVDLSCDTIPAQLPESSRNVRFAPSAHIRTYSLVLGDHPLCYDGLSIELGWDYSEEEQRETRGSRGKCQKRSYLSRKQLLLEVAGCTKEQLDERTRNLEAERSQRELARSYREDYYYCLAFHKQQR